MKSIPPTKKIAIFVIAALVVFAIPAFYYRIKLHLNENKILKQVISRLEADTRVAEVLVTGVNYDEDSGNLLTTIKFLEYDVNNKALLPKHFTFSGNIIQFQSLVIRFDDIHIRQKSALRGKSAALFWKVFMLDGSNTQEYEITQINKIPAGYKLKSSNSAFEKELWENFWKYALNPKEKESMDIKNAQIEAPGTMFIPGIIYALKIEHDGGIRIDAAPIPQILKGEIIPK